MKKVVRTVWISLLSGLAFLVACTSGHRLTRSQKKSLKEERTSLINSIEIIHQNTANISDPEVLLAAKNDEINLLYQIDEIDGLLKDKDAQQEDARRLGITLGQIDSLQQAIQNKPKDDDIIPPCVYGPPPADSPQMHRRELMERLTDLGDQYNKLKAALKRREGACVYGSPEVIERYKKETNRLRHEADSISQEIQNVEDELNKLLDNE
jgi:uncharacterized coiled-coil DUF342 family protein